MSEWAYNDRPAGIRFVPGRVAEPGRTELEELIWDWIVRGQDDPEEFVEYLGGDDDEERQGLTDEELAAAYADALEARRSQQRAWGPVRSNLTGAFAELNDLGVLARENFTCCGTCASAEIGDERDNSRHWHGYVWYHQQDTEALAASPNGAVYLGYGSYGPEGFDRTAHAALPKDEQNARYQAEVERLLDERVFPVLRKHGMQVVWDRDLGKRVLLTGAQWYTTVR